MSVDLIPFFATMVVVVAGLMRYQHIDNTKTRDLIDQTSKENRDLIKENRDLIDQASKENRDLIDKASKENRDLIDQTSKENRDLIKENREMIDRNRDLVEKYHLETAASIGEVRERLARIEGRLEIWPTPPPDHSTAEAA